MNILHITNDYLGSSVYKELYFSLANENINQTIYCPVRNSTYFDSMTAQNQQTPYDVVFSSRMNKMFRFAFRTKIKFLFNDILKRINFNQIEIIHATTLFSDGALAYMLFKRYKTPYLVTVRNTDLNLFLRYMFYLRPLGLEILRNAKQIVFISPVYLKRFEEHSYIKEYFPELQRKTVVIPNGINSFWINNYAKKKETLSKPIRLLFIGKFARGKNVKNLIKAVDQLVKLGGLFELNLVGGGGDNGKIVQIIKEKTFIRYHGKIYDKQKLKAIMRLCDIFVMPSKNETFGLVYIEALSQGLPVIFTKNEGIDGLYDRTIGETVDSSDVKSIINAIQMIAGNYHKYSFSPQQIANNHNWDRIAKEYLSIYTNVLNR